MLQDNRQPVHSLGCAWRECIAVKHVRLSDSSYDQIQALIIDDSGQSLMAQHSTTLVYEWPPRAQYAQALGMICRHKQQAGKGNTVVSWCGRKPCK